MKLFKDIHKKHINSINTIEGLQDRIKALTYAAETRAALDANNISLFKELHAAAKNNAGEVTAINEQILLLQLENKFLQVNEKTALFAENYPAIAAAFAPYEGKSYGEKTAEKIREALHGAGLSVWFSSNINNSSNNMHLIFLNEDGYKDHNRPELHVYTEHETPFIDGDNKIHVSSVEARITEKYTEDPKKAAKDVLKAFKAYQAIIEKADAVQSELNHLLPGNMESFRAVDKVYRLL